MSYAEEKPSEHTALQLYREARQGQPEQAAHLAARLKGCVLLAESSCVLGKLNLSRLRTPK